MKKNSSKNGLEQRASRPLFSFWGFRLGCATLYWAAAFVALMNAIVLIQNLQAGKPLSTDRRLTWVMVGLLLMLAYHQLVGWWPFRRRVNPEYERWAEARRRREEAEQAAAEHDEMVAIEDENVYYDETATETDDENEPPDGKKP